MLDRLRYPEMQLDGLVALVAVQQKLQGRSKYEACDFHG
jgi:hypothetical protein